MAEAVFFPLKSRIIVTSQAAGVPAKAAVDGISNIHCSLFCSANPLRNARRIRTLGKCKSNASWVLLSPPRIALRRHRSHVQNEPSRNFRCASGHGECIDRSPAEFARDSDKCSSSFYVGERERKFHRRNFEEGKSAADAPAVGRRHLMGSAVLLSGFTAFITKLEDATAAVMESERADLTTDFGLENYRDVKNGFTLLRPTSWNKVDKPGAVIFFEDPKLRSSNIGVTVSPVKIASLDSFGTVDDIAKKLVKAERDKGSTKDVQVINQFQKMLKNDIRLYSLEYLLDTTRGGKHVLTSVTVAGYKLYVLSIVFAEDSLKSGQSGLNDALHQVLGSFDLLV